MTTTSPRVLPQHRTAAPVREPGLPAPSRPAARRARVAGRWRYEGGTGEWWWSEEMGALHGVPAEAGCTEALVAAQHPDDRPRTVDALAAAATVGHAFCLEVRVLTPGGGHRAVTLLGEPRIDDEGRVGAVEGLAVESPRPAPDGDRVRALEAEVEQLRTAMAGRAPIEQAKGALMLLTGCGEQAAFELLAHVSSHVHRKVRDVALDLVASASGQRPLPADVKDILRDACPPGRPAR